MPSTTTNVPRVYVACLASYNAGRLHGRWLDAVDLDELREGVAVMLAASPAPDAEEWAIHDHEGFGPLRLSEYESLERVAELGAAIADHGPAFATYASHIGQDHATPEGFEEAFRGEWQSEREFAEELARDLGYLAEIDGNPLAYHIDWESWARELFCGDYWSADAPGGFRWIFASC